MLGKLQIADVFDGKATTYAQTYECPFSKLIALQPNLIASFTDEPTNITEAKKATVTCFSSFFFFFKFFFLLCRLLFLLIVITQNRTIK